MTFDPSTVPRDRSLYVASPLYGNVLHYGYHTSICGLLLLAARHHINVGLKYVGCDSLVPRARNLITAHFLDSSATDLLFIDADITFSPEDALSLLASPLPILGGVYPRKQHDWTRIGRAARAGCPPEALASQGFIAVANWPASGDYNLSEPIPMKHLGTGFLRIRREVLVDMIAKLGDRITFDYSQEQGKMAGRVGYDFFPTGPDIRFPLGSGGRQYLSEDWAFCELARECGFTPYAAPWIKLTHSGYCDFSGDLSVMDYATEEMLAEQDLPEEPIVTIA